MNAFQLLHSHPNIALQGLLQFYALSVLLGTAVFAVRRAYGR